VPLMRSAVIFLLVTSALEWLVGAACARPEPARASGRAEPGKVGELVVRRGDFERYLTLTGEIDAAVAFELQVPRTPTGQVTIRYLAPEGAEVKAGEVIVELDSSSFLQQIKDKILQLSQAEIDLERQISQSGVAEADKALELERKRAALRRAEVDADVPPGILPKRDYLEKQMALHRARVDLERAEEALAAQKKTAEADLHIRRLSLEKLRRAVQATRAAIATLVLRAPEAGTVILGDHPEGRKFQEGDDVLTGTTIARVSASQARRVRASLIDVDDGKVAVTMPARTVLDAHPERTFRGTVRELSSVARAPAEMRAQRRAFTALVELEESDMDLLRPGLSARVEVITERERDALLVPRVAVDFDAPEGPSVYQASGGAAAPVTLGACNAEVCVVTAGLAEGARLRKVLP
jgi:HlyD family secretion protein